jgi:hypothetical protein
MLVRLARNLQSNLSLVPTTVGNNKSSKCPGLSLVELALVRAHIDIPQRTNCLQSLHQLVPTRF